MLFGSYRTGTERLAEAVIRNQSLDTQPSKKVELGNEIALLNLRPPEPEKYLGKPGRFRLKGQSGEQLFLDRLTRVVPSILTPDLKAKFAAANQMAESDFKMRQISLEAERRKETKQLDGWQKPSLSSIKPLVPHKEMHKKTYFNAIEKLLTNPSRAPKNQNEIDPTTWGPGMIFENSIKHPPARAEK